MHSIDAAFAHLAEDLFGPVTILQVIDAVHAVPPERLVDSAGCDVGGLDAGEEINGILALFARPI